MNQQTRIRRKNINRVPYAWVLCDLFVNVYCSIFWFFNATANLFLNSDVKSSSISYKKRNNWFSQLKNEKLNTMKNSFLWFFIFPFCSFHENWWNQNEIFISGSYNFDVACFPQPPIWNPLSLALGNILNWFINKFFFTYCFQPFSFKLSEELEWYDFAQTK